MSRLTSDNIIELTYALIGGTSPVGETNADIEVRKNLRKLTELTDWCLTRILEAARYKDRPEASMKGVARDAYLWLADVDKWLDRVLPELKGE